MNFNIEVNEKTIQVRKGDTILTALYRNGIKVPTLCSMKNLSPTGACRICVVEVEGISNLVTSCSYIVEEGMKVKTHSPRVIKARKTLLELLLGNHPDDCLYCQSNGDCELQNLSVELNVRERRILVRKTDIDSIFRVRAWFASPISAYFVAGVFAFATKFSRLLPWSLPIEAHEFRLAQQ